MPYFFICNRVTKHAVKSYNVDDCQGKPCISAGCRGKYKVIERGGAPHDYSGVTASVTVYGDRFNIQPVFYKERAAQRTVVARSYADRNDASDSSGSDSSDSESEADDDGPAYVGDPQPWKGPYSRCSQTGRYAPRPNLAAIVNGTPIGQTLVQSEDVNAGGGRTSQNNIMGGSAAASSGRNLPQTTLKNNVTAVSEEWCHLIAVSLGGDNIANNLVAASYACNTYMATIEMCIKNRTDLSVNVTAYNAPGGNTAEVIRYTISKGATVKYREFIDATATHFNRADLDRVKAEVQRAIGKFS